MMDTTIKVGDTVSFLSLYTFVDYAERRCVAAKRKRFTGKVISCEPFDDDGLAEQLIVVLTDEGKKKTVFWKRDAVKVVNDE